MSRLLNMGIEPFLVASSVNLIAAQRLLRKLCKDCKAPLDVPEQVLIDLGVPPQDVGKFQLMKGKGCGTCNNTGYKGRIACYEIMFMSDELAEFILNGASTLELKREAIRQGMKTLRMSALRHLGEGNTSIEEVVRPRRLTERLQRLERSSSNRGDFRRHGWWVVSAASWQASMSASLIGATEVSTAMPSASRVRFCRKHSRYPSGARRSWAIRRVDPSP